MAKKSRRARAKKPTGNKSAVSKVERHIQPSKSALAPKVSVSSVESSAALSAQVNNYRYILPELRRIGIISGILFLILIVLTFVLG